MYTVPYDFVFLFNNALENSTKIYSDENETQFTEYDNNKW